MTEYEVILSGFSMIATIAIVIYIRHIIRNSGRDRPNAPSLVSEFVRTAPLENLKIVCSDSSKI